LIEKDPNLKGKIKIIGIGAGNTPYEVQVFKSTYNSPFPLFSDKDFSIHNALGDARTPYFLAVRIKENGTHEVVLSRLGAFNGAQDCLESILSASGLQ
jgi:peroxiredoxin